MESLRTSILVTADARGVAAGLAPALVAFNQFESRAVRALTRVGQVLDRFGVRRFAGFAVGAASLGLLAQGLTAALGPAIRFEDAFAGVLKTVDGTPRQLAEIRSELISMSQDIPIAATELANIAAAAGQLGVRANEVTTFTRVVAELAATTDLGFDGAARNLARFLNVVDGSVGAVDSVSNVLVDLGNNFATTESQILTFATRLGPAFSAAGATSEEILGIATAFSALGIQAELGGSALNRVITEIADSARLGDGRLQIFADTVGLLPDEFREIASTNPVEAFRLFVSGLGEMQGAGESITPTLEALGLNGIRITQVLTTAANQTGILESALNRADRALAQNSARQEEYGRRVETTASRLQIFENRLTALAITAGTPLLDGFAASVDGIGDQVVRLTDNLAPLGNSIVDLFANVAAGLRTLVSAAGGLDTVGNTVIGFGTALAVVINAINALGPAGPIILGVGVAMKTLGITATTAGAALGRFAAAGQAASLSTTKLAGAVSLARSALAGIATIAGVFALIELGSAIAEANRQAEEAAETFRGEFNEALKLEGLDGARERVADIRTEIQRLEELDTVPDGLATSFEGWGQAAKSVFQILTPGTENTILNARRAAEELNNELNNLNLNRIGDGAAGAAAGLGAFEVRLANASRSLDLSKEDVVLFANELGLIEDVTQGSAEAFSDAIAAIRSYALESAFATTTSAELRQAVREGTIDQEGLAVALGLSSLALSEVAERSENVDLDQIFEGDPDKRTAALAELITELVGRFDPLAAATGQSTSAFLEQSAAVRTLSDALGGLEAAIERARNVQEQMRFQQELLTEAQVGAKESLDELNRGYSDERLRAYAESMLDLTLAQAANAGSADEALLAQRNLRGEFIQTAVALGAPIELARQLADEVLGIPESAIIDIQSNAAGVTERVQALEESIANLDRQTLIEIGIIDEASGDVLILKQALEALDSSRYEALLDVNDVDARTKATLMEEFLSNGIERTFLSELDADSTKALAVLAGTTAELLSFDDILAIADLDADGTLGEEEAIRLAFLIRDQIERDFVANLTADDQDALAKVAGTTAELLTYDDIVAVADLDADGTVAESEIFTVTQFLAEYGEIVEEALLEADGEPASEVIARLIEELANYDEQAPVADLLTDPTEADNELDRMLRRFGEYDEQRPEADLLGDSSDIDTELRDANRDMDAWNRRKAEAEIRARSSQAERALQGVINLIARIKSKTVTITTVTRGGGGSGTVRARGGIERFAAGGFSGFENTIPAPAGVPAIYSPAPAGSVRIHSEPVTGGEAYIPLGGHIRPRSQRIWYETGKLLGVDMSTFRQPLYPYASGGINLPTPTVSVANSASGAQITIASPVTVSIDTGGGRANPAEIERIVNRAVSRALDDAGRELRNRRFQ